MADKKETPLGIAIFLYVIALIVIGIIAYNLYYSLVFVNYGVTGTLQEPAADAAIPEKIWYAYASLFFPLAGNTPACNVIAVAVPVLIALLIAASRFLAKHFSPDKPSDETDGGITAEAGVSSCDESTEEQN